MKGRYLLGGMVLVSGLLVVIFFLGIIEIQAQAMSLTSPWRQVNVDGFGKSTNGQIPSLAVFNGYLYAGTQNYGSQPNTSEIWRTASGDNWEIVDVSLTSGSAALIHYKGYLYAGSWNDANGGNVWRTSNGLAWTDIITDGFGDPGNGIARFAVYSDTLYAGTWNGNTGTELWRTSDGLDWEQFGKNGLGNPLNGGAIASAEFKGLLYLGIGNWIEGAEIWRTDGITLTSVITGGFGITRNASISALAVFNDRLYASIWREDTIQVWQSANGSDWTQVVNGDIGSLGCSMASGLEIYEDRLYIVMQNDISGLEVWRTRDGSHWEQAGTSGFGDANNTWSYWDNAMTTFNDRLYIASNNYVTGGETWEFTQPPLVLFLPVLRK